MRHGPFARAPARREHRQGVADGRGVGAQTGEQRAQDPRACLGVGQRPVRRLHLDPQGVGEHAQAAPALERQHRAGHRGGAQHRRIGPLQADAPERLAQDAAVKRSVVGDEHAALEQLGQRREHVLQRRRAVHHRLGDAGEPLDAAAQWRARPAQRAPAVVQLAAADQDGTDLGELAVVAGQPVGLGIDDHELGGGDRSGQKIHLAPVIRLGPDGVQESLRAGPKTGRMCASARSGLSYRPRSGVGSELPSSKER